MKSIFITGTDTDVGKTCVTASIARLMHEQNIDVGVMKPFASGVDASSGGISDDVKILIMNSFKSSFLKEEKKKEWISKL